jgi:hypothetical protein
MHMSSEGLLIILVVGVIRRMAGRANRARYGVWTARRSCYRNSRGIHRRLAAAPTRRPPRCGHGRGDRKCDYRGHHLVVRTQSGPWWRPALRTGALVTADCERVLGVVPSSSPQSVRRSAFTVMSAPAPRVLSDNASELKDRGRPENRRR